MSLPSADLTHLSSTVYELARYWSEIATFPTPLHLAPLLGVFPLEFRERFVPQKTRIMGLPGSEDSLTIGWAVLTQYQRVTDGQTDGQTDVQPIAITCVRLLTHVKNPTIWSFDYHSFCKCPNSCHFVRTLRSIKLGNLVPSVTLLIIAAFSFKREAISRVQCSGHKTRCWALDRVHNSRRPLDRLFALCDPVTLTYDPLTVGGRELMMYYPCVKFGDFSFSRLWFHRVDKHRLYRLKPHLFSTSFLPSH